MCLNNQITIYCERFLVTLQRKGRRPSTVAAWRRSLHRFYRYAQTQGVSNARYVPLVVLFAYKRAAKRDGCSVAAIREDINRLFEFVRWIIKQRLR